MTWTAVEDGLPEDGSRILCYALMTLDVHVQEWVRVTATFYKNMGEFFPDWDGWLMDYGYIVTHWMPLPPLPEME